MCTVQIKRSTVKEVSGVDNVLHTTYCMEVTGPILPKNMQLLKRALNHCHSQYSQYYIHIQSIHALSVLYIVIKLFSSFSIATHIGLGHLNIGNATKVLQGKQTQTFNVTKLGSFTP